MKLKTRKLKILLPRLRYLGTSLAGIQQQIQLKRCRVKLRKLNLKNGNIYKLMICIKIAIEALMCLWVRVRGYEVLRGNEESA